VSSFELNELQTKAAFTYNEAGISKLYVSDLKNSFKLVTVIPTGTIGRLKWFKKGDALAITIGTYNSGNDVYVYHNAQNKLSRWTESETGDMNLNGLTSPELISWKSFDKLEISGFMYRANNKFTGKRPVIINIHGGPEVQSLPVFIGRNNYYLNELGITIIYPNVRGSVGYGKSYTDLDNGFLRKNSVQDIGALIDWIKQQPELDGNRIMITGGSYGGYMTLACAVDYSDRIRCALDVVGISNFKTFLQNTESYRRDLRRVEYGDERDSAMAKLFDEISPSLHVDKVTVPLFIVQGKNDPRVPYTESQQMVEQIKKNGKSPVWFLMADDEGHGFAKKNNQDFQFYATVLFVKKYLLD
jgi:dipeptidyl aminopeptidase/acylaminoacyl peptidase